MVYIEHQGGGRYLLTGELTFATAPELWSRSVELFGGGGSLLVDVDLAGITHSDSAAVALRLEWMRLAQRRGRSVAYRNVPAQLLAVAEVCGVERLLPRVG